MESRRQNLPDTIATRLEPWRARGLLPEFPLGTDFTEEELVIVRALTRLKGTAEHPLELIKILIDGAVGKFDDKHVPEAVLERMGLAEAQGLKDKLMRTLFVGNI